MPAGQPEACPRCRRPREPGSSFCTECGHRFSAPDTAAESGAPSSPPPGHSLLPPAFQQPQYQARPPQQQPPGYGYPGGPPQQPAAPGEPRGGDPGPFPQRTGAEQAPPAPQQSSSAPPRDAGPPAGFPPPAPPRRPAEDDWPLAPPGPGATPPAQRQPSPQAPPSPFGDRPGFGDGPAPGTGPGPVPDQGSGSGYGNGYGEDPGYPVGPGYGGAQGYGSPAPAGPPSSQESSPAGPGAGTDEEWVAVVAPDAAYFTAMLSRSGPEAAQLSLPDHSPEQRLPLSGEQITIGRRRNSTGEAPDIDLSLAPEDPGVSHRHAMLVRLPEGGWTVVDQNSTNGTTVNGAEEPIEPYVPVPLQPGDRVHVGAWTTITVLRG
ncbi:FHA domain-containing protein [Streptomyces zingiberis]|uniref:FHA domain-containing protein n=1 Tax=Streptomyces zingiberis TaxID=2053010 RepID=UPI002892B662|nr:FHA domain-containing protein [Streptomyces zingiberis]